MSNTDVKVTRNCPGCGQPSHLVQDNSGSMWMHDTAAAEYQCWRDHRDLYEDGTL